MDFDRARSDGRGNSFPLESLQPCAIMNALFRIILHSERLNRFSIEEAECLM